MISFYLYTSGSDTITTLFLENFGSSSSFNLVSALNKILEKSEFVRLAEISDSDKVGKDSFFSSIEKVDGDYLLDSVDSVDAEEKYWNKGVSLHGSSEDDFSFNNRSLSMSILSTPSPASYLNYSKQSYEFKITLEQLTIYELMLDDQREYLHDLVASYYELERTRDNKPKVAITPQLLSEEGYHWENGKVWSSALFCYYEAAKLYDEVGDAIDSFNHLIGAYNMLCIICNVNSKKASTTHSRLNSRSVMPSPATIRPLSSNTERTTSNFSSIFPNYNLKDQLASKKDLQEVFCNDSQLLETALNMLLALGRNCVLASDEPENLKVSNSQHNIVKSRRTPEIATEMLEI